MVGSGLGVGIGVGIWVGLEIGLGVGSLCEPATSLGRTKLKKTMTINATTRIIEEMTIFFLFKE